MLRAIVSRSLTTCNKINSINVASAVTNSSLLLDNVTEKKEPTNEDNEIEYEEMFVKTTFNNIEWGGPLRGGRMPEPTRFGDWERKGRCTDY
tara:strand:+ start:13622 stop:13897 length:276 start_codon:yes stop_codon:yes gene_type:complete